MSEEYDVRFKLARNCMVVGPSCCGKSHFVAKLIQNEYFTPSPKRIFWFYGQDAPSEKIKGVIYQQGIPSEEQIDQFYQNVVILDDLMMESRSNANVANLFTRVAHHRQCLVILLSQNLYQNGSCTRTQSLNTHYLILFKNPRDKLQVQCLARQMYPQNPQFLQASFEDATREPYNYLLIDLNVETPDNLHLRTNIFMEGEDKQSIVVYIPNEDESE